MTHESTPDADPLSDRPPVTRPESEQEELPLPIGTLFLMMLYIMLLAGMWAAIYFEFLGM